LRQKVEKALVTEKGHSRRSKERGFDWRGHARRAYG
jgi:hypothetical protein